MTAISTTAESAPAPTAPVAPWRRECLTRPSVVVDLEGISFIDSSGLSVLIHAYKRTDERDGSLTVRSPSPTVVRLLDMTGQSDSFLSPGA